MAEQFAIQASWVRSVGEAIGARNGVSLKDALVVAEDGKAVALLDDSPPTISAAVDALYDAVTAATRAYWQRTPLRTRGGGRTGGEAVEKERELATETALRVAVTGALVQYQREREIVHLSSTQEEGEEGVGGGEEDASARRLKRSLHNTLLRGLLYAFNAFLEMHSMTREHYPPRSDHRSTTGTIGWDTLVLLHFVHHIPQTARYASGAVIDESTGQVVRGWRRLLVALQSIDPSEAPEHSRRRGALALANGLLIFLFQRYNTHQCAALLKAIDHAEQAAITSGDPSKSILKPSQHIISEVVTHYYYKGRMCLYERRMKDAHAALNQAYLLLPPPGTGTENQQRNKQRVRFFLVVAGVVSGHRVPQDILACDPLLSQMFGPLVHAIERGDPVAFTLSLEHYGPTWRRRGVYLLLQQAKMLCFLMLLARVHSALGTLPDMDNSRVTLDQLISCYHYVLQEGKALATSKPNKPGKKHSRDGHGDDENDALLEAAVAEMDDDRMALWTAKMIAQGYVRGYLSYEHKTLVLSKKDPFPLLSSNHIN